MNNKKVYIMSGDQLCGIGVPGELCIAGEGLARGYLNRPELTAEKFVQNPFGEGRMYRSGDLARWLPDGNIEYLGRIDEQVKIRGFRIELGEVESVLKKQHSVTAATAVIRKNASADPLFCAYFTADTEVDMQALRNELSKYLPDYMIPSYMMQIPEIPLTPNGKVDIKHLPDIEVKSSVAYAAPENEIHTLLVQIFCEVLEVENVGIDDSYFELGGDSIKAIRIISRLKQQGYQLASRDLLNGNTIRVISLYVARSGMQRTYSQEEFTGFVDLLPIQEDFFREFNLPEPAHFNQTDLYKITDLNKAAMQNAIFALCLHHDMLRAVVRGEKLFVLPYEAFIQNLRIAEFDLTAVPRAERETWIYEKLTAYQSNFDLQNGPLIRVAFLHEEESDHVCIAVHHLVVDSVSGGIMRKDLTTAYSQALVGSEITLPAKTMSYAEWSETLNRYMDTDQFEKEERYWKKAISEIQAFGLEAENPSLDAAYSNTTITLESEKISALQRGTTMYNATTEDILMTALVLAAKKALQKPCIAVMMESHGRAEIDPSADISHTVGWFTTAYPVCLKCENHLTDTLVSVIEAKKKITNCGIAYSLMKRRKGNISLRHIDFSFNYLGEFGNDVAKFDELVTVSSLPTGNPISSKNEKLHNMIFNSFISEGSLQMNITYNADQFPAEKMEQMKMAYLEALDEMAVLFGQEKEISTIVDIDADFDIDLDIEELNSLAENLF